MSDQQDDDLDWTGERYVPQIPGNIRLEHLHRYLIASQLSHNKRVLDLASGEGYGAAILATVASHVVGVDNAPDVVAHAARRYARPNLEFKHGVCEAIPLPDDSVDMVVSFETLEHVRRQDDMMREIRRVLAPGGLLIISSPDRHEYSEVLGNRNPYHVTELDRGEFERLLRSQFANVAVAGQRIQGGSLVAPLDPSTSSTFVTFPASTHAGACNPVQGAQAPVYLLALASAAPLPTMPIGLLDGGDFAWTSELAGFLSKVERECAEEISRRLGDSVELEGASVDTIRAEFARQVGRISDVAGALSPNDAALKEKLFAARQDLLASQKQLIASQEELVASQRARLASEQELIAVRAIAKAHAAAEQWLEQKAHRLESDVVAQREAVAHVQSQLAATQHEGSSVRSELTAQLAASTAQLSASNEELAGLRVRIGSLQAELEVYERSHSWRLTAPLRAMRRLRGATPAARPPVLEPERSPANEPVEHVETGTAAALAAGDQRAAVEPVQPVRPLRSWRYPEDRTDFVPLDRVTPVETRIKLIAFYLPQYHPIPENDAWWGKGFTEWTSVTRGRPQFEGHFQPRLPGELGFYDLRLPEVQRRQIELARLHGIHGFCYYHYWFGGKKLLHRPLGQVLSDPELDFPFCICWANENWTRRWDGRDDEWLVGQQHSAADDLDFIRDIEPALRDRRYIRVGNRPLLLMYRPALFPDAAATAQRWRTYCREVGIGELFLMSTHAFDYRDPRDFGFDAALEFVPNMVPASPITAEMPQLNPDFRGIVYDYRYLVDECSRRRAPEGYPLFRSVAPMWDNEARRPNQGTIFAHSSPGLYRQWLETTCRWTERHIGIDKPFVFVNAWNEWAEGAHLEPDQRFGYGYLKATADAMERFPARGKRPSVVCVSHDALFYGAQALALNLVRTLSSRLGYDVDVILYGPGPLTTDFEAVARVHDFSPPELTRDQKLAVMRHLYDQGARIAICNTSVVGEAVELLKLAGFSVVSLIHELPGLIQSYGLEASVQQIAKNADRIVFAATVVRDSFVSLVDVALDRCVVQPQGLFAPNEFFGRRDVARRQLREHLGLPEHTRIVLAVGSADHRKGIDLFAEAGTLVVRQLADVVFVWVGHHDPASAAEARSTLDEAGVSDRFLFPGPARNSDLFFAGADAYLMTSREDPFPNVVIQALDAGLPVIGFEDAGGFVELLHRDCGVLVPFGDTRAMAEAVVRILGSPIDVEKLSRVGREILCREFSFVNYARGLVGLVETPGPRVSVIVPNYNYAQYLPARLESIVNQTYPPHEVLFLDDCSTDDSVKVAEEILHSSGLAYRIVENATNQGTYRQWLRGLREATGDLVWIAEADDDCAPTLLQTLVGEFERPDVVLAYCQSRQIDGDGREIAPDYLAWTADVSETKWRDSYVRPGVDEICDALAIKNTIPNVSAVLMRRSDLSGIEQRLMTLKNAGDWLLYVHLLERGNIAFVAEALNSHRRHASSVTIGGNGLNLMREILIVQQYVAHRHTIARDVERKREADLQRTYEYLGLNSGAPASYKDHEALRAVMCATTA